MYKHITVEIRKPGIGVLTLNQPNRRNALSIALREEVSAALDEWVSNPAVRAVLLTGAGVSFSAGFDLKEFAQPELLLRIFESSSTYHRKVWSFPKIIVAAVNGPALGGGFDLATLCDIRLAAPSAVFGHPEIKFGAPPLFTPLRWLVGDGRARELCLTGRRIDAAEALRIGLVTEVVDADRLLDRSMELLKTILEAPDTALRTTKGYLASNSEKGFEESFQVEHDNVFREFLHLTKG